MAGLCLLAGALGSCNRYLDTMPDTRTELNRADKIERLLVSAYPTLLPMGFTENRTDKVLKGTCKFTAVFITYGIGNL